MTHPVAEAIQELGTHKRANGYVLEASGAGLYTKSGHIQAWDLGGNIWFYTDDDGDKSRWKLEVYLPKAETDARERKRRLRIALALIAAGGYTEKELLPTPDDDWWCSLARYTRPSDGDWLELGIARNTIILRGRNT